MSVDLSGPVLNEFHTAKKAYSTAVDEGDADSATKQAVKCARLLYLMADNIPSERQYYRQKAAKWYDEAQAIKERGLRKPKTKKKYVEEEDVKTAEAEFKEYINSLVTTSEVTWKDIGGLEKPKRLLQETIVVDAMIKPEGLKPWEGILLYGPPGTGKTLLASAAAGSMKATFFNVSAGKVLSKYYGESSKLVDALYDVALEKSPSIVFIDELDDLTLSRSGDLSEASRRTLATLLTRLAGFKSKKSDKLVLTLGATNRPWDIDEAALDRFPRRIHVPLPDIEATEQIIKLCTKGMDISKVDPRAIAEKCNKERFSGRNIFYLCQEAMWNMIREQNFRHRKELDRLLSLPFAELRKMSLIVRPLIAADFESAFQRTKVPLSPKDLEEYAKWTQKYGERA